MSETYRNLADFQEYLDTDGELRSAYETYITAYHDDPLARFTQISKERYLRALDRSLHAGRESTLEDAC